MSAQTVKGQTTLKYQTPITISLYSLHDLVASGTGGGEKQKWGRAVSKSQSRTKQNSKRACIYECRSQNNIIEIMALVSTVSL